ncbi:unnamed protein product [Cochlearia groenlandica]
MSCIGKLYRSLQTDTSSIFDNEDVSGSGIGLLWSIQARTHSPKDSYRVVVYVIVDRYKRITLGASNRYEQTDIGLSYPLGFTDTRV